MGNNVEESQSNIEDEEREYPSSQLLLEHITKEYDKEDLRASKMETRIPIFLTIATFFGGFVFTTGSSYLTEVYKAGYTIYSVYIVLYSLCIIMLLVALGLFVWILCSKKYKRINIELFGARVINEERVDKTAFELIQGYQEVLRHNITVNDIKIKQYNIGIALLVISAIFYLIVQIIKFII